MISNAVSLFAAVESEGFFLRWRADGFKVLGLSPFTWALLLVVVSLVAWAYLVRSRRRERSRRYSRYGHRHHHHRHRGVRLFGSHRRRRRRRKERPRNPTLAETGGLPPPRTDASGTPET